VRRNPKKGHYDPATVEAILDRALIAHVAAIDVWAGEIPLVTSFGEPLASPGLRSGIAISASIHALLDT